MHGELVGFVSNLLGPTTNCPAGYNFKSLQHIFPSLEPSGLGVSSLWARSTALKYNTNVVVGYPERVDVAPIWPTGSEYYNSAIIMNGDGEIVANYRKSFLYSTDELWALEGKNGFFQGHLHGLGQTALGICKDPNRMTAADFADPMIGMDLNPYRFEAPWQSFEFGFHVLEVRAHLVIVTMAWLSREGKDHSSQTSEEPDMEALAYWIQRLEPVVKAEDKNEVIVVFCNRTGSEGDAVYAGTSAVVGIKDGEVRLYGLLGRGSNEVLVVDTDNQFPISTLLYRPEGGKTKATSQTHEPMSFDAAKMKGQGSTKAEPTTRSSQALPQKIPQEISNGKSSKEKPAPKLVIPEQQYRRVTSGLHKTPIAESPYVPTPTAPSPTPFSARPSLATPSTLSWDGGENIDTPYARGNEVAIKRRGIGVLASDSEDTRTPAYSDVEHLNDTDVWLPSQNSPETPIKASIPLPSYGLSLPPYSAVSGSRPGSRSLIPYASGDHRPRADTPQSENSSLLEYANEFSSRPSRKSRDSGKAVPVRPVTTSVYAPVKSAHTNSQFGSRSRRHRKCASGTQKPDSGARAEQIESAHRETQSAMVQRQCRTNMQVDEKPISSKSPNTSHTGRPSYSDWSFMERDRHLSRGSTPIGVREFLQPRPDMHGRDQGSARGNAAPPIADTQYDPISRHERAASWVESVPQFHHTPSALVELVEPQKELWPEISRIVGEHMGRSNSQGGTRGRQRSTSADSHQAIQESCDARANVRAAFTQTRQENGVVIRSVREPSMGPLADPEDDIVAEIIFRHPGYSNHACRSQLRGESTPDQPAGSRTSRKTSRPSPDDRLCQGRKASSPRRGGIEPSVISDSESGWDPTPWSPSALLASHISVDGLKEANLPDLSSSGQTLNSDKTCPTTPSQRCFEPSTPKAMFLPPDYGSLLSAASDALSDLKIERTNTPVTEKTAAGLKRRRSNVW